MQMRGSQRLDAVEMSTPAMAEALPDLPMTETIMIRIIRICIASMGQFFEPVFRSIGLTENSFHVLCLLMASETNSASPSELSELVGTSRANMTKILDGLLKDGFISRGIIEKDGRRHWVTITPRGICAASDAVPRLSEPLRLAFSGLTREEFVQLELLLRKAIASFDKNATRIKLKQLAPVET
jgi:MarR family transcriptional repressor of emrRAB